MTKPRKGQAPPKLGRDEFRLRFYQSFKDPNFESARDALAQVEQIGWENYTAGRKAPFTRKAGP
jgi:hypothetical protein